MENINPRRLRTGGGWRITVAAPAVFRLRRDANAQKAYHHRYTHTGGRIQQIDGHVGVTVHETQTPFVEGSVPASQAKIQEKPVMFLPAGSIYPSTRLFCGITLRHQGEGMFD